ncbi:hypothetical protein CWI36_0268p0060 [Hamiltosporidium magnivora]|uniref:Uncharacterized protein n=1 Tax=Hamiltosporidium magnivora TaxID=148818 RepID=A0A4Q9LHF9_9MICR|nr:hypothetical protein CWI36_0268p0060 [Hamiltosporidium magnivora]
MLKKESVRPSDEALFCYAQDRNIFRGAEDADQHSNTSSKTVYHVATRSEKNLGHDYTIRHNEVFEAMHLHFILDKRKKKMTLIEVGIAFWNSLQIVEIERLRKYDLLANELSLIYKCSVEIIPYMMTLGGLVTKYHKTYAKGVQIPRNVEAYIQSIPGLNAEKSWKRASFNAGTTSKPFKAMNNDENGVKHDNRKNNLPPIILDGEDSDLEEEKEAVKMVEDNIQKR